MLPLIDVYALSVTRDESTIEAFAADYVDVTGDCAGWPNYSSLLPINFDGHEDELRFEDWQDVVFNNFEEIVCLGLSRPWRAFRVYLTARQPWSGALLCFTRTGELVFGLAGDSPERASARDDWSCSALSALRERVAGVHGWTVHGEPPPLDPWFDRPWESDNVVTSFSRGAQGPVRWTTSDASSLSMDRAIPDP